jgi:hypothetical protein
MYPLVYVISMQIADNYNLHYTLLKAFLTDDRMK